MVASRIRLRSALVQGLQVIAVMAALVLVVWLAPAMAQQAERAAVVLDGEPLFSLSSAGEFTAQERADLVNTALQQAVQQSEPVTVEVQESNKFPMLYVNGQRLVTVTERDVLPGNTRWQQANQWAEDVKTAVQAAQTFRSAPYLRQAALTAVGVLAMAIALHGVLGWVWRHLVQPALRSLLPRDAAIENESQELTGALGLLVSLGLAIARGIVWFAALLYITNLFPLTRQWSYRLIAVLLSSFTAPILTLGNTQYSLVNLAILAALLIGLVAATRMVTNLIKSRVLTVAGINRGAQEALGVIIQYGLLFLGTLVLLQLWGLDISSLAILASALGVGIGFGLQDIAKNFGSGLVLVFERPIQVGDFVQVGDFEGTVERIGARSTVMRTLDRVSIIVPNSRFLEEEVINWNHDNPVSRLHLPVGVAYGSDIDCVRSLLLEATDNHPYVLSTPPPQVFFKEFGDSSLNFELLVWTADPSRQMPLKSDLYFRIEALFRQHQVEIPFPQRDLNLRTSSLPIELPSQLSASLQTWLERSLDNRSGTSSSTTHQASSLETGEKEPFPDNGR